MFRLFFFLISKHGPSHPDGVCGQIEYNLDGDTQAQMGDSFRHIEIGSGGTFRKPKKTRSVPDFLGARIGDQLQPPDPGAGVWPKHRRSVSNGEAIPLNFCACMFDNLHEQTRYMRVVGIMG